ncbi:unnamed protein product [Cladocopium goreaui]|uniref:Ras-related protein RABA1e (AtRABA1e) n=1 Tax=Cladocopium goreaui TaxID=2562237 RepID=A0A9P1M285_9DINO|nr:unnamed protein product [Cladocopium goreaui]
MSFSGWLQLGPQHSPEVDSSVRHVKKLLAKELSARPSRLVLLLFGRELRDEELLSLQRMDLYCKCLPHKVEDYSGSPDHKQDAMFKVVLAGATGAGKTSILRRFVEGVEPFGTTLPTLGVDVETKKLLIDDSVRVSLRLWDSQGSQTACGLEEGDLASLYAGASLVLLCIAMHEPCQELSAMHLLAKSHSEAVMAIVVNKADLKHNDQLVDTVRSFARDQSCFYFEVSARTGQGVDDMFHHLVGQLLDMHSRR